MVQPRGGRAVPFPRDPRLALAKAAWPSTTCARVAPPGCWIRLPHTIAAGGTSGIHPYSRGTWLMEVLPAMIVLPVLWVTHRRFRLPRCGIFRTRWVLFGGRRWHHARGAAGLPKCGAAPASAQSYDKLGHFVQGFVARLLRGRSCREAATIHGRRSCWSSCAITDRQAISAIGMGRSNGAPRW